MGVPTVVRHEATGVFDAAFWLECEREADRVYRVLTGADHSWPPAGAGVVRSTPFGRACALPVPGRLTCRTPR